MDESNNEEDMARALEAYNGAWSFKKGHIISELTMIEQRLIVIRNILDGSRTLCECCKDKKWINEKEGRLKMELGGLISKVNRVSSRASKVK